MYTAKDLVRQRERWDLAIPLTVALELERLAPRKPAEPINPAWFPYWWDALSGSSQSLCNREAA